MRTLTALVASLAMLAGWTSAEAAEARITKFVFGCETPDGRKLKPKFGDVGEAFYTDLPGQRQQCLETIDRKIALCRENTSFESNTKDEKYAGCLPVFEEQAEVCVAHFERERAKCGIGASAPAEAARLDSSERQRVQAALTAEGYDPGPADGKFGQRTRRAIEAWQQANGHAATGELTSEQVTTLLAKSAPAIALDPTCTGATEGSACWKKIANRAGCHIWTISRDADQMITWSGACPLGIASGQGELAWTKGGKSIEGTGSLLDGREHGEWTYRYPDGTAMNGTFVGGKANGNAVWRYADGSVAEGPYVDHKQHGRWVQRSADGTVANFHCNYGNCEGIE